MSLLLEAERYIANQSSHLALNAFIAPLRRDVGKWQEKVQDADLRRNQGKSKSKIDGRLIALKDNICTRDFPTTCASKSLETFTSPFNATVVRQLEDAGGVVAGKTNLDEFGMGSHSTHSRFGPVKSARRQADLDHLSAGGSSGGSAVAVATDQCYVALGTDTGGSIRLPAAYTGVVGFKPSYGLISRWGVVAYANSLDTVGILAKTTSTVGDVFNILNHHDPRDPTSLSPSSRSRISSPPHLASRSTSSPLRIGVPVEYNISELTPSVRRAWHRSLEYMREQGHSIQPISLPMTKLALSAYYILAPAEASSNLAKYDGVRYGTRSEGSGSAGGGDSGPERYLYANTRGEGFGAEVQRRILLGAFSLSAQAIDNYFLQAQRIRRLVQQDFNAVFRAEHPLSRQTLDVERRAKQPGVDVLICPTAPSPPPTISDLTHASRTKSPLDAYVNDVFTVPASLAGLPAISIPVPGNHGREAKDNEDLTGVQIVGQYGDDELVLKVGELLEGCKM
ncbi:hypothetical protein P175DRAFT_0452640 [Aspergillus ochraceoroseus IBT 24754]|uniref:Glutamyl-tRNA(Gln) amidotransferase subunit A, mitochondrial n=2 Tax=Aspergillus ochraceoroseus TaxID=138278 RepID=A0A2T5M1F0_9EURO|nr:uncharacterized protein P175DRAFT_0452640 [Aspergillus ochraceoroseus IBT 24754]KKK18511.1 hypothetical protein AOCH_004395 [Aspergillus ochraceoroseus]PTU22348.1 hypothetical protein P175DRAFT_0452640 [Aspergillus ochraceoroseus IBT 24754]